MLVLLTVAALLAATVARKLDQAPFAALGFGLAALFAVAAVLQTAATFTA